MLLRRGVIDALVALTALGIQSVNADTFSATITWYGTNDERGSPNCNSNTVACGFYTFVSFGFIIFPCSQRRTDSRFPATNQPGFSAAVSQNLFSSSSACYTCYRITGRTDAHGKAFANAGKSLVVMVNNLCPATSANPLCSQKTLNDTNSLGAQIDVNLCNDSGANEAFFGGSGVGLAVGTAEEVSCSLWEGQKKFDAGSGGNTAGFSGNTNEGFIGKDSLSAGVGVIGEVSGSERLRAGWFTVLSSIVVIGIIEAVL